MAYPLTSTSGAALTSSPSFPEIEQAVLAYWREHDTFVRSVEQRDAGENGENEFVFYDGPPFANGLPHYGHLLTGYVKDVVPRYQTMRGRRVERRFGWDTHGLPAELEAMSQLGIKTKDEILELGIETFNDKCRESVLKYTQDWQDYVTRQARWVDFDNDYKTLNVDYMESVLWAFKSLHDKGLVYEGFRVLPYCWNDQTPLSNHELRMDEEVYQVRRDPAVTVGLRILPREGYAASSAAGGDAAEDVLAGALALVWTTTPWTLPSNLAIMVGEDIDYVVVESDFTGRPERYVLAEARLAAYARELGEEPTVVARMTGAELAGRSYVPPFSYYQGWTNAHRLVTAEFVTTTDGSGLVHTAGAFGEDDKVVTDREDIEAVMPVGADGCFTAPVDEYAGLLVFDANASIIDHLKAATRNQAPGAEQHDRGAVTEGTVLLRREAYDHSYPHCWRCREPLIYKGVSSWFVEVTKFKDDMLRTNEQITWVPEHVKHGQFGTWLSNARDWSISRNRFWGSPIPVWVSDDPKYPRVDVYGSLDELKADFGDYPRDHEGNINMHRPYIDELTRPNPDDPTGKSTMHRISDVLDCWFESGSMPFAQYHYPFENKEYFEQHFPSDFIVEYIGQTRGWFYLLHVMATALFDKPAFKNVICHGIVLGDDGQKMSKHLRNYPDVNGVFDKYGSDAMRWFLMSSPILRGGNLIVTSEGIRDTVRQIMLPVWSSYYFFTLYANAANNGQGYDARELTADEVPGLPQMDRYLLARTRKLIAQVSAHMDAFEISDACDEVSDFIDMLTNWYIRNTRDRFWNEDENAFNTLYTVLEAFMRVLAPLAPMEAETVWRGLTGGDSVHLGDWPYLTDPETGEDTALGRVLVEDGDLVAAMDKVREVVSATLSLRKAKKMRVRQPLAKLTVVVDEPSQVDGYDALLKSELNIKDVEYSTLDEAADHGLKIIDELKVNARAAGPRLGKQVQFAIKASKSGDWHTDPATGDPVIETPNGTITLQGDEYDITRRVEEADVTARRDSVSAILPSGGFVILDLELTGDLIAEGYARDVVRAVQDARKEAGLEVSDRIALTLTVPSGDLPKVEQFRDLICSETLSTSMQVEQGDALGVHVAKA